MALESSWELLKTKCKGPALKYPALACPAPNVKEPQCSWPGSADLNWGVGTTQLEPHLPEWWLMASLQSPVPSCAIRSHFPVGRKGASLGLQTRFLHQNCLLWLSVFQGKQGRSPWQERTQIKEDKPHLSMWSRHLVTVMQPCSRRVVTVTSLTHYFMILSVWVYFLNICQCTA